MFLYNLVVIIFSTFCLCFFINRLLKGNIKIINFVYIGFYFIFVLPIILDLLIGVPQYKFLGFKLSREDVHTSFIYNTYLIFITSLWLIFSLKDKVSVKELKKFGSKVTRISRVFFYLFSLTPLLLWVFSPSPSIYLKYGAIQEKLSLNENVLNFHTYIHISTLISIIAVYGLLLTVKRISWKFFLISAFIIPIDFWLNGKRSIILFAIALLFILILVKKQKRMSFWKTTLLTGIIILGFYQFDQFYYKEIKFGEQNNSITFEEEYSNFRINYGRDDVTRLSIYSLIKDDIKILEYPGQSFLFYTTIFIPRELWVNKPWPYPVYLTSAVFANETPPIYIGWTMTSSWLEESISNLGFIGFLFGPLSIALLAAYIDKQRNLLLHVITIFVIMLSLMLPFNSFLPIILIWAITLLLNKFSKEPKNARKNDFSKVQETYKLLEKNK